MPPAPVADLRLWSLAEANQALPQARLALAHARQAMAAMRESQDNIEDLRIVWGDRLRDAACPAHAEWQDLRRRHDEAQDALASALENARRAGFEVKDVEAGLVDFPAQVGNRTVYLCWRDGEDAIRFYHSLEGGFAGRKPVPGL